MDTKTVNLRDLPEDLVRRAKACAALHGKTLKDFVIGAISEAVEKDIPFRPHRVLLSLPQRKLKRVRRKETASE